MTQILVERATIEQALEALEHHGGRLPWITFVEVLNALKAALAQEQPEPSGYCTLEQLVVMQRTVPSPDKIAIYTAPPQRPPLTVPDLQQALVDTGLIFPEAIDDAEGFDHGVTLERIDKLHLLLVGVGS